MTFLSNKRARYTIEITLTGKQWNDVLYKLDPFFMCQVDSTDVARVKIKDALRKAIGIKEMNIGS